MKVVFCTPTPTQPFDAFIDSMRETVPLLDAAGIEHKSVYEIGSAYISWARSNMLHKAMKWGADMAVFIDHDMGWKPSDLPTLINTPGDVVAGTYRFKQDEEEYMSTVVCNDVGQPKGRKDGCILAKSVPAGFLKVTRRAVEIFGRTYPELLYGSILEPQVDLFNHGAYKWTWWGEDYSFSRRWCETGNPIWLVPDLDIDHYARDGKTGKEICYPGNFHKYLLRQPRPEAKAA